MTIFRSLSFILLLETFSNPLVLSVSITTTSKKKVKNNNNTEKKSKSAVVHTVDHDHGMGTILKTKLGKNPCDGADIKLPNLSCFDDLGNVNPGLSLGGSGGEQAGADVTKGYQGLLEVDYDPITTDFYSEGMCATNVHWHLGAEHRSKDEFDENGVGPDSATRSSDGSRHRSLVEEGTPIQEGFRCHLYDASDKRFTTEYKWKYCHNMKVGETYEVHWPSSNLGMCGTPWQYQYPFKDGVLCKLGDIGLDNAKIGVHGQVFTIINDEDYYYPDMIRGMMKLGNMGKHVTKYTGSTTGQSVNNDEACSAYTGVTWQVDRKCHLISASSFDKMCHDMLSQADDMSGDIEPHGSRELVDDELAANNHVNRKEF